MNTIDTTIHPTINIATFVLDEDKKVLQAIAAALENEGIAYQVFRKLEPLMEKLHPDVHICIIDHIAGDGSGLNAMKEVLKRNPQCFVIIMSPDCDTDSVIEFLNSGASRFVKKLSPEFISMVLKYVKEGIAEVNKVFDHYNRISREIAGSRQRLSDIKNGLRL